MPSFRSGARAAALCLLGLAAAAASLAAVRAADDHSGPAPVRTPLAVQDDSTQYAQTIAGAGAAEPVGQVALTVTNYGFLGTNYLGRGPSFEYPYTTGLGPHVDHLVRGGLWLGAKNLDEGVLRVSTATLDGTYNTRSSTATEYTPWQFGYIDASGQPAFRPFLYLSNLPSSQNFDSSAVSNQDIIGRYVDAPGFALSGEEDHQPIVPGGLVVRQRSLAWGFEPSDKFVVMEFTILNPSPVALDSVYVGMYTELASVDKSACNPFPTGCPGGVFASKDIAYVDSLHLVEEHRFPPPEGQTGAYSWDGIKFLGAKAAPQDTIAGAERPVNFRWFTWEIGALDRNTDSERYHILSDPVITPSEGVEALETCMRTTSENPTTCDPVNVLSHGPYRLSPGDSLVVAFGFVGGDDEPGLQENARAAQRAYDLGYRIPQPPPSPILVVTPGLGAVTLRWEASPETFRDKSRNERQDDFEGYRVYISEDGVHYNLVREADVRDSLGYNTGLEALIDPEPVVYRTTIVTDPITGTQSERQDSTRYVYTITGLKTGFRYWVAVTSYDIGDPLNNVGPLESGASQNATVAVPGPTQVEKASQPMVFPNPYRGRALWDGTLTRDKLIWFVNLPSRCEIRVYTLAGNLVHTIDFDAATYHGENARLLTGQSGAGRTSRPILSGTMAAWNMISSAEQEVGSGLYMFSVTDKDNGKVSTGHFVVIK